MRIHLGAFIVSIEKQVNPPTFAPSKNQSKFSSLTQLTLKWLGVWLFVMGSIFYEFPLNNPFQYGLSGLQIMGWISLHLLFFYFSLVLLEFTKIKPPLLRPYEHFEPKNI